MNQKHKTALSERRTQILIALISVFGALVAAYWQFVYKPANANGPTEYAGRVLDANTKHTISGAKVSVESTGVPQIYYTDSEGVFYLKLKDPPTGVRIRVVAEGYKPFDRNVSISRTGLEDVPLMPITKQTITTQTPTATPNSIPEQPQRELNSNNKHVPRTDAKRTPTPSGVIQQRLDKPSDGKNNE